jgi:hypothetical protein
MRALVEHRHAVGRHRPDDRFGGEAGTGADVDHLQPAIVQAREGQRPVAHRLRPEQRVDPAVVAQRDHPVEPARLGLVLDEAHRQPTT